MKCCHTDAVTVGFQDCHEDSMDHLCAPQCMHVIFPGAWRWNRGSGVVKGIGAALRLRIEVMWGVGMGLEGNIVEVEVD